MPSEQATSENYRGQNMNCSIRKYSHFPSHYVLYPVLIVLFILFTCNMFSPPDFKEQTNLLLEAHIYSQEFSNIHIQNINIKCVQYITHK